MPDFLDILAEEARRSIQEGYYKAAPSIVTSPMSMRKAIQNYERTPVITELKFASPSEGQIRGERGFKNIVNGMVEGGAVGLSILTEPKRFRGNIEFIPEIREDVEVPILMKDIILSPVQIEAASRIGANVVLLIQTLFDRGYCLEDCPSMIDYAHSLGLEVLLEVHSREEFLSAQKTSTDMIGINNRDLKTLQVDLEVTKRILSEHDSESSLIVSESGITQPNDIRYLRRCGAKAFLVGTAIMKATDVKAKVRELVEAL